MNPKQQKILERQAEEVVGLVRKLDRAVAKGRPADVMLGHHMREHREYGGRDRRFYSEAVFSFFRWKGWTGPIDFLGPEAQIAVSYLLDAKKTHPVIPWLAERGALADRPLEPLFGRSLVEKGRLLTTWLEGKLPKHLPWKAPAPEPLAPAWVTPSLCVPEAATPEEHVRKCLTAFQERPPTWLCVRQGYREAVAHSLAERQVEVGPSAQISRAVAVLGSLDLSMLRAKLGQFFWVQDIASQCVGLYCAPQIGERWWDACAGAGGKTLLLLELMQNRGQVLATDIRGGMLGQLQQRAERAGFTQLATGALDASKLTPSDPAFDGVLVDAPCSGLGTWSRNPDARWRTKAEEIGQKASLQLRLLLRCCEKVRPGGVLVYSVCTMTRDESQGVVRAFLRARTDFALDPIHHPFHQTPTDGTAWIWPWEGPGDGMFMARLKRSG